jgi:hypothetical protein
MKQWILDEMAAMGLPGLDRVSATEALALRGRLVRSLGLEERTTDTELGAKLLRAVKTVGRYDDENGQRWSLAGALRPFGISPASEVWAYVLEEEDGFTEAYRFTVESFDRVAEYMWMPPADDRILVPPDASWCVVLDHDDHVMVWRATS